MSNFLVRIGAIAGVAACIMEYVIEFYAASKNPGYSSISQSISYLGNPDSPTYRLIQIWSIILSALFICFALGFYDAFKTDFSRAKTAFFLIIIYGLGEGLGAGIFSMDNQNSWSNVAHNVFSSIGDLAMVLFPLNMLYYFKKGEWFFSLFISLTGIAFGLLFILAKLKFASQTIPYNGLLQRVFQGIYYLYFLFIAYKMSINLKVDLQGN